MIKIEVFIDDDNYKYLQEDMTKTGCNNVSEKMNEIIEYYKCHFPYNDKK